LDEPPIEPAKPRVIPEGIEPPSPGCKPGALPLDQGTLSNFRINTAVAEVGVEPTSTRLSIWRLCQFAYPADKREKELRAWELNPSSEPMKLS
jgi:hypothetical protein